MSTVALFGSCGSGTYLDVLMGTGHRTNLRDVGGTGVCREIEMEKMTWPSLDRMQVQNTPCADISLDDY